MAKSRQAPSCDWRAEGKGTAAKPSAGGQRTRLHRHLKDHSWSGVATERYKDKEGSWSDVLRRTLVGGRGEETKFHLRYFEIAPGGRTSRERHVHEHVVVCVRGTGRAVVRGRSYELNHLDTLYIPPEAVHQLQNPAEAGGEPFGFFCIVDAERDRPVEVED